MNARIVAAVVLASLAAPAIAQMIPGQWSLSATMEVAGRKQAFPAVVECISKADIDSGTRTLPRPEGKCSLSNVVRAPDGTTYDLACINGSLQSQGRAHVVFEPERYYGNVSMAITDKGAPAQLATMRVAARRVGECK